MALSDLRWLNLARKLAYDILSCEFGDEAIAGYLLADTVGSAMPNETRWL